MSETTKTVKVRIAVAVDKDGDWASCGYRGGLDDPDDTMSMAVDCLDSGEARYWLTAELPLPIVPELPATVEPAP